MFKMSHFIITRACPRSCAYCNIRRDTRNFPEMAISEIVMALRTMEAMSDFVLVLGNEPWVHGKELREMFRFRQKPYGMYTSAHMGLFAELSDYLLVPGGINNYSCGCDYPEMGTGHTDDMIQKSNDAWEAFRIIRSKFPHVQCMAQVTVTAANALLVPKILDGMAKLGVNTGLNLVHTDMDGKFDFCAKPEQMEGLLFDSPESWCKLTQLREMLTDGPAAGTRWLTTNLDEFLSQPFIPGNTGLYNTGWHCGGDPIGGPTVDSDGSLRCCSYRRGKFTPVMSIFDLPKYEEEWRVRVRMDAQACPGCQWSCPRSVALARGNDTKKDFITTLNKVEETK